MASGVGGLYRDAFYVVRDLLSGIVDGDLGLRTPCAGRDLRTLMGHMVGQN
jgi:hypothetical protein